jgi:LacI family transcriptional regulator, galactose operon repressor
VSVVNVDNYTGMRLAVEHIVGLGHRRVAFVQGGRTSDGLERREAFVLALREHNVEVPESFMPVVVNDFNAAAYAVEVLLRRSDRPTAILASTDVAAIGTLKAASRLGFSVPQQLSVIGFDDIPLAEVMVPSLTTVRQPMAEISERAIAQLMKLIAHPQGAQAEREVVAPMLIVRDSTAPPSAVERPQLASAVVVKR